MKQLLLPALLAFGFCSFAQENQLITSETVKVEGDYYTAEAQKLTYDPDERITELTGDADFSATFINITNADRIVFDENTKEVVAYGNCKVDLLVPLTMTSRTGPGKGQAKIRYKLGDDKAYLE